MPEPVVSFSAAFLGESGVAQTGICLSHIISYPLHGLYMDGTGGFSWLGPVAQWMGARYAFWDFALPSSNALDGSWRSLQGPCASQGWAAHLNEESMLLTDRSSAQSFMQPAWASKIGGPGCSPHYHTESNPDP